MEEQSSYTRHRLTSAVFCNSGKRRWELSHCGKRKRQEYQKRREESCRLRKDEYWVQDSSLDCILDQEKDTNITIFWNKASLVTQLVKNLPAKQKTWVWFLGQEDPLEKEMATHSSTLTWRIPWTEEPGRVQSMGYKESDMTVQLTFTFNWRREWQPTPVFLPGKSHRQRGLAGYSLGGQKELDTTEWLSVHTCTEKYINHKGIDQLCFTS